MQHWDGLSENENAEEEEVKGDLKSATEALSHLLPAAVSPRQHISLEFGDEYYGEVATENGVAAPHGQGIFISARGGHRYIGSFSHRWRDGYGQLITERFELWCKWRMNRPDFTTTARLNYPNGDKYCGFLALRHDEAPLLSPPPRRSSVSKFTTWLRSCVPVRCRWGEITTAGGDRYFGEWENDCPHGFGCYISPEGDSFIGIFRRGMFHGTGTLFSFSLCSNDSAQLSGVRFNCEQKEEGKGKGQRVASGSKLPSSLKSRSCPYRGPFCIFDGVWSNGLFQGEGHVTLPNRTRVTAEWRGVFQPYEGEVVISPSHVWRAPTLHDMNPGHLWQECFHWESILCGASVEAQNAEGAACAALRDQLSHCSTAKALQGILVEFLSTSFRVQNAVKIFRRCFYFFYGTCGSSSEIGAGLGGNSLGWCCLRNAFGGCIHPRLGRPISEVDLNRALLDIFSFTRSVQRWVYVALGIEQARSLTEASVGLTIGRWVADAVLQDVHAVLMNLYAHVYSEECARLAMAMGRMRGRITLDDMGVEFARHFSEERLFDPYADAVHCIAQIGLSSHTLTSKLGVLTQWSRDIDLSTRLTQVGTESIPREGTRGAAAATPAPLQADRAPGDFRSGSADDLLPIHQYVLSQCSVKDLYAHAQMLADFASEDSFVNLSSQESFCVTTLLVCIMALPRLSQFVRDERRVLVPASFHLERMKGVLKAMAEHALPVARQIEQDVGGERGYQVTLGVASLVAIARGYIKSWVPHAIECVGCCLALAHSTMSPPRILLSDRAVFRKSMVNAVALPEEEIPNEIRFLCWRVAGSLLETLGLEFSVLESSSSSGLVELSLKTDCAHLRALVTPVSYFVITWRQQPLPSFLLYAADVLRSKL